MVDILSNHKIFYDALIDSPERDFSRFSVGFSVQQSSVLLRDNLNNQEMKIKLDDVLSNNAQKVIYDIIRTIHLTTGDIIAAGKMEFLSALETIFLSSFNNRIDIKAISLFQVSPNIDIQAIVSKFVQANLDQDASLEINAGGIYIIINVHEKIITNVVVNNVIYNGYFSPDDIKNFFDNSLSFSISASATPLPTYYSPSSTETTSPSPSEFPSPSDSPTPSASPTASSICSESASYVMFGSDLNTADDLCKIDNAVVSALLGEGFAIDFSTSNIEDGIFYIVGDTSVELNNLNNFPGVSIDHDIEDPHYFAMSFSETANLNDVINLNLGNGVAVNNINIPQVSSINFKVNGSATIERLNTRDVSHFSLESGNLTISKNYSLNHYINIDSNSESLLEGSNFNTNKLVFSEGLDVSNSQLFFVKNSNLEIGGFYVSNEESFNFVNSSFLISNINANNDFTDFFLFHANANVTIESLSKNINGYIYFIPSDQNRDSYVNVLDFSGLSDYSDILRVSLGNSVVHYYGSKHKINSVNDFGGGTNGSYYLVGGDLGDYLAGSPNNDILIGHGGSDVIYASIYYPFFATGADFIDAGSGDDSVFTDIGYESSEGAYLSSGSYWDGGEGLSDGARILLQSNSSTRADIINFEIVSFFCAYNCNFILNNNYTADDWTGALNIASGNMLVLNNLYKISNSITISRNSSIDIKFNKSMRPIESLNLKLNSASFNMIDSIKIDSVKAIDFEEWLFDIGELLVKDTTDLSFKFSYNLISTYNIDSLTLANNNITLDNNFMLDRQANHTYALEINSIIDVFDQPVTLNIKGFGSLSINKTLPENIINIDASLSSGKNKLYLGSADNFVKASSGSDFIDTGPGSDIIIANNGVHTIYAGPQDDLFALSTGYNIMDFPDPLGSGSYWHGGPESSESNKAFLRVSDFASSAKLINFARMNIDCTSNCNFTLANNLTESLNSKIITLRNINSDNFILNNWQPIQESLQIVTIGNFIINFNPEIEYINELYVDLSNNMGDTENLSIRIPAVRNVILPLNNNGIRINTLMLNDANHIKFLSMQSAINTGKILNMITADDDILFEIKLDYDTPNISSYTPLEVVNFANVFTGSRNLKISVEKPLVIDNILSNNINTVDASNSLEFVSIRAGNNDNIILSGLSNDSFTGGGGIDTISYIYSPAAVNVNLTDNSKNNGGSAEGDILLGIENVIGSVYKDVIVADSSVNSLSGLEGNDVFVFPRFTHNISNIILPGGEIDLNHVDKIVDFSLGDKIRFDFELGDLQSYNESESFETLSRDYFLFGYEVAIFNVKEKDLLLLVNPGIENLQIAYKNGVKDTSQIFPLLILGGQEDIQLHSDCNIYQYRLILDEISIHSVC